MTPCEPWTGSVRPDGYGTVSLFNKNHYAHRLAYAWSHGITLSDISHMVVLHMCDNPTCVRVDHLRLGSHADNSLDMAVKGRGTGKFDAHQVAAIRDAKSRGASLTTLAVAHGVTKQCISLMCNRKTYRHVP